MSLKYNKSLVSSAQLLRKEMTKEEKHLWYDFLKKLPVTVNRQKNIGNYIVDFYIASKNIVIELDGSQHYEEQAYQKDKERDNSLFKLGIKVLRYQNTEINKNFNGVCRDILNELGLDEECLKFS
ncbi:MAG: endonuclease domain-containing protein [Clostridia bacterium]|nr:endonuclease domain-containing protein [Clostridia bacterium]